MYIPNVITNSNDSKTPSEYSTNIDEDLYFPFSDADCERTLAIDVTLGVF